MTGSPKLKPPHGITVRESYAPTQEELAARAIDLEAAILAFFRESYIDLTDPRISAEDFSLPAMRRIRDVLGIKAQTKDTLPDWWDNDGVGPDGMADHPFEGVSAHEGLGPCTEPKGWCHTDCGLPEHLHHPYAHFADAHGVRVR